MSRSKYSLKQSRKPKKTILLAVEGEKTEKEYFENYRKLRDRGALSHPSHVTLNIEILPTDAGKSSPDALFDRLNKRQKYMKLDLSWDQCWIVCDVDRWIQQGKLQTVAADCKRKKYQLAVSNPSFEVWLLLHFIEPEDSLHASVYKKQIGQYAPLYSLVENNLGIFQHLEHAIRRAKQRDHSPLNPWPEQTTSRIYRIFETILLS